MSFLLSFYWFFWMILQNDQLFWISERPVMQLIIIRIEIMKVLSIKLPPLPCKNVAVSVKGSEPVSVQSQHKRKYSVQHLQTTDQASESGTCTGSTTNIPRPASKKSISSSKTIRVRQNSLASKKPRKTVSMEDTIFSDLPPNITAKSWILYEMRQGKTLYAKRSKKVRQFASLTKIMNLITILEILEKEELKAKSIKVRATKASSSVQGTTAEIKYQAEYCMEDLLYGMMLPSGNDAAFLIAELGGFILQRKGDSFEVETLSQTLQRRQGCYVNAFLRQMNKLARKIGLNNSNFASVHGMNNPQNISCAEDLAFLCRYAMKNQIFRKIVHTQKYHYACTHYKQPTEEELQNDENAAVQVVEVKGVWQNTNKMLGQGWSGLKTGITPNAGPCLAASLFKTFSGKEYQFLVILLDSESMDARWQEVQKLVDWAILTRQYL